MSRAKLFGVGALILVVVCVCVFFFMRGAPEDQGTSDDAEAEISGGIFTKLRDGTRRYENATFGFSMVIPEGYTIAAIDDGDGRAFLVRGDAGGAEFQITVTPFDEEEPLTPERITQDIPDMRIDEPHQVIIGEGSVTALIFVSDTDAYGEGREAWFAKHGHLYQVSAPLSMDMVIGPMLESMRFLK